MSGDLIVAAGAENRPFSWAENATMRGFSVDLCQKVFGASGRTVRWYPVSGPFQLVLALGGGSAQAGLDVAVSDRRQRWFQFSQGYFLDRLAAFLPRSGALWPGLEHLHGRLAVRANSYEEEFLRFHYPLAALLPVDTAAGLLEAVTAAKAVGFVMSEVAGRVLIAADGRHGFREAGHSFAPCRLALACMHTNDEMVETFNQGLSLLYASGEYDALVNDWFGERPLVDGTERLSSREN